MIDNIITIEFSESIQRESVAGQIYITPRQTEIPKLSWDGKRLDIILPDNFRENTTYVINLGTEIKDIRGNRLEDSYSFAFSTGENIDRGDIAGYVARNDKPAASVTIGLYPIEMPETAKIDSVYPPYLTLSGSKGDFKLEYLPEGSYIPLAFIDKNKNQLFDYPAEAFGLPDRVVQLRQRGDIPEINFNLIQIDTSTAGILTVSQGDNNLIRVRMTKSLPIELIASEIDKVTLTRIDSGRADINAVAVKEYGTKNVNLFNFYFPGMTEGRYLLKMKSSLFDKSADDFDIIISSGFEIRAIEDTKHPRIESFSHADRKVFPDENQLSFHFSEPVTIIEGREDAIRFYNARWESITADIDQSNPFKLDIIPDRLDWDETYIVNVDGTGLSDLSGNLLADTTINYPFSVHSKDSLGKISGTVSYGANVDPTGMPYLEIKDLQGKPVTSGMFTEKDFSFELPPGQYFLSGYIDRNLPNPLTKPRITLYLSSFRANRNFFT
jgi:hypothetical protein